MTSPFDALVEEAEQAPRFRVPVSVLLDPAAYNRSAELNAELEQVVSGATLASAAEGDDDEGDVTATSRLEQARDLARQMVDLHAAHPPTRFVFEQLPGTVWGELEDAHPDGDRSPRDPFWVDVMAASCVEPEGSSVEGWGRWQATLGFGQWETLRRTCETANLALFDLSPSSAATALARGTRPNSTTPAPAASLSLDSVDE